MRVDVHTWVNLLAKRPVHHPWLRVTIGSKGWYTDEESLRMVTRRVHDADGFNRIVLAAARQRISAHLDTGAFRRPVQAARWLIVHLGGSVFVAAVTNHKSRFV